MKLYQKLLSVFLTLFLLLSLTACGQGGTVPDQSPASPEAAAPETDQPGAPADFPADSVRVRTAALKGPTAMGLVHLMSTPGAERDYDFTLAGSADEVTPALIKGDLDVACVPANLAAVLYNKTEGQIVTLAVNTLGVLYIVENGGESVRSMADLKGRTIAAAGKGSTPEYGLRYLLEQSGLDPDTDVTVDWKSEHAECVAAMAAGTADIALLPQPFVAAAQSKLENLRVALDLTEEWDALDNGSAMITGVAVARRAFAEEHPEAVERFLEVYAESVDWVNGNPAGAAELIAEYGIVESAAVAEKALPHCNIVCLTGQEMYEKLSGYLQVLAAAAPEAVGGAMPRDDFFYGA